MGGGEGGGREEGGGRAGQAGRGGGTNNGRRLGVLGGEYEMEGRDEEEEENEKERKRNLARDRGSDTRGRESGLSLLSARRDAREAEGEIRKRG